MGSNARHLKRIHPAHSTPRIPRLLILLRFCSSYKRLNLILPKSEIQWPGQALPKLFYKGEKLEGYFGSASDYHGLGPQIRRELMIRLPTDNVRVLDVGTGSAGNVEFLTRVLSSRSRIWTLDPSQDVIGRAKEILSSNGLDSKIEFIWGNADKIDLQDGFFDRVVSVMTLHHIGELGPAVREMLRVLKAHGKLLLVDYGPVAADRFQFLTRHTKSDFFDSKQVDLIVKSEGATVKTYDFDSWFLVEGTKRASNPNDG